MPLSRLETAALAAVGVTILGWAIPQVKAEDRANPPKGLSAVQMKQLRQLTRPEKDEWKWARLPWELDTQKAFEKAGREGKPIFTFRRYAGIPLGGG
jgi:hypothetical protein